MSVMAQERPFMGGGGVTCAFLRTVMEWRPFRVGSFRLHPGTYLRGKNLKLPMSVLGHKRPSLRAATASRCPPYLQQRPNSEMSRSAKTGLMHRSKTASSFNHVVGNQEETYCLSSANPFAVFRLDHQVEFDRLLNGQLCPTGFCPNAWESAAQGRASVLRRNEFSDS